MILNMFSKTKILDSLLKDYNKQYDLFVEAYNELLKNEEALKLESGIETLGDTKVFFEDFLTSKNKEFKESFGAAFEIAFTELYSKYPSHVTKWLKEPNNHIPKFVSSSFVEQFRELLCSVDREKFSIFDVSNESRSFIPKLRDFIKQKDKYYYQRKNMGLLKGEKSFLLESANKKTYQMLKRQEEYINFNISLFNKTLGINLFSFKYDLVVDINEVEFDQEFTLETLRFVNMILQLIETNKLGVNQSYLQLLQLDELKSHDLDVSVWKERLEDFNLLLIA